MTNTTVTKICAPAFLAGAAAATILLAPVAGAGTSATCSDNGPASVCTRDGHAAIYATPRTGTQTFSIAPGSGNPFGSGPMPPMLAID
jgi:hypothetical protein